ncbi:COG3014 family protein [Sphingobacterium lactis]|uniref:COG3014 family protein n=1 Tax=Sphingobacterium lactis TaxID=797291 RepID=UPI003F81525D
MKTIKNMTFLFVAGILVLYLGSCATAGRYQDKNQEVFAQMEFSNFQAASLSLDAMSFFQKDRNKLLYFMEKGKLEHMLGNFARSNSFFEQAYILLDDGIKNSVGTSIVSNLTNPMMEKYKGEDFEKVLIHYYKALNFYQLGKADTALIEAKRINIKLNELNDKYPDNKNKYQYDAFAQILQGIIYESLSQTNDAFIAYRNAEKIYDDNGGIYMGVATPLQLKKDLLRTSKVLGFTQEHKDYLKKYPNTPVETIKNSAIVFWENGLGPKKSQMKLSANGVLGTFVGTYSDDDTQIILPIPAGLNIGINVVAFPEYIKGTPAFQKASLQIDGREQYFEVSQDLTAIAKQCLKDRAFREALKTAARFASKKAVSFGFKKLAGHLGGGLAEDLVGLGTDALGAATEKADTRNWQSLPATISYTRVALPEKGEKKIPMTKYGSQTVVDTIILKASDRMQIVSLFDINNSAMGGSNIVQGNAVAGTTTVSGNTITAGDNTVALIAAGLKAKQPLPSNAGKGSLLAQLSGDNSQIAKQEAPSTTYGTGGIGLAFGLGVLEEDGIGSVGDYGMPTFQLDYTGLKNHLNGKFAHGPSISLDYYYSSDDLFEDSFAVLDFTVGYGIRKYFSSKQDRLSGFYLTAIPTIGINFLEVDESSATYEFLKLKNSFDVSLKTGLGYDFAVGNAKKDRIGIVVMFGIGFLNRNMSEFKEDMPIKSAFMGTRLTYEFGN